MRYTPRRRHLASAAMAALLQGEAMARIDGRNSDSAAPPFSVTPTRKLSSQLMASPPVLSWPGGNKNETYLALGLEMPILATAGGGSGDSPDLILLSPENYLLFVQQKMSLDSSSQFNMSGGLLSSSDDPFVSFEEPSGLFSSSSSSPDMRLLAVLLYSAPSTQTSGISFNWTAWATDMSSNPSMRLNFDVQDFAGRAGIGQPVAAQMLIVEEQLTTSGDNPDANSETLVPVSTLLGSGLAGGGASGATATTASGAAAASGAAGGSSNGGGGGGGSASASAAGNDNAAPGGSSGQSGSGGMIASSGGTANPTGSSVGKTGINGATGSNGSASGSGSGSGQGDSSCDGNGSGSLGTSGGGTGGGGGGGSPGSPTSSPSATTGTAGGSGAGSSHGGGGGGAVSGAPGAAGIGSTVTTTTTLVEAPSATTVLADDQEGDSDSLTLGIDVDNGKFGMTITASLPFGLDRRAAAATATADASASASASPWTVTLGTKVNLWGLGGGQLVTAAAAATSSSSGSITPTSLATTTTSSTSSSSGGGEGGGGRNATSTSMTPATGAAGGLVMPFPVYSVVGLVACVSWLAVFM